MVTDFRRRRLPNTPVNMQGSDTEMVDGFKYLGFYLNKLDWSHNTDALSKKVQSCLHPLRSESPSSGSSMVPQLFTTLSSAGERAALTVTGRD